MSDPLQLSELLSAVYDTVLDPDRWPDVLERTAAFVGGKAATLASHDTATGAGNFSYVWGDDPAYRAHYLENLARTNPVMVPLHLYCTPGQVFSLSQIYPYEDYCRSRLYLEWAKPQGWGDFTHGLLEKSGSRFGTFGVAHAIEHSPAAEEHRRRLRLVTPHVTRAVEIAKAMQLQKIAAETLSSAVNSLAAGVFLVKQDGSLAYANESGQKMIDAGELLQLAAGVLTASDLAKRDEFRRALAETAEERADSDGQIVVLTNGQQDRFIAQFVALTKGERRNAGTLFGATAALFVYKAQLQRPTLIERVAKEFEFTEGEARAVFTLLEAGTLSQTAAALGISEETVKTHLKRVFRKTGTSRQADLVQLIASFANPML